MHSKIWIEETESGVLLMFLHKREIYHFKNIMKLNIFLNNYLVEKYAIHK